MKFSRREFLKLCSFGAGSILTGQTAKPWNGFSPVGLARVAWAHLNSADQKFTVSVYSQPDDTSPIVCQQYRDEILHVYAVITSDKGPGYNPVWYRVWRGYIHSAHMIQVENRLNRPLATLPEKGLLAEVTVPYTQAYRHTNLTGWEPVYRLYSGSNHWIIGVENGPDDTPWYRLREEIGLYEYMVKAEHLRPIPPAELTPIAPEIPFEQKRVEVSINNQTLTAYQRDQVVLKTKISTGLPTVRKIEGKIPTETPRGTFNVQLKTPSRHMGEGNPTADPDDPNTYELPGVPWVSFFEPVTGVAFHGTYWHNNFGMQMSHGCVNMRNPDAKWLYRWLNPITTADRRNQGGYGTQVIVQD